MQIDQSNLSGFLVCCLLQFRKELIVAKNTFNHRYLVSMIQQIVIRMSMVAVVLVLMAAVLQNTRAIHLSEHSVISFTTGNIEAGGKCSNDFHIVGIESSPVFTEESFSIEWTFRCGEDIFTPVILMESEYFRAYNFPLEFDCPSNYVLSGAVFSIHPYGYYESWLFHCLPLPVNFAVTNCHWVSTDGLYVNVSVDEGQVFIGLTGHFNPSFGSYYRYELHICDVIDLCDENTTTGLWGGMTATKYDNGTLQLACPNPFMLNVPSTINCSLPPLRFLPAYCLTRCCDIKDINYRYYRLTRFISCNYKGKAEITCPQGQQIIGPRAFCRPKLRDYYDFPDCAPCTNDLPNCEAVKCSGTRKRCTKCSQTVATPLVLTDGQCKGVAFVERVLVAPLSRVTFNVTCRYTGEDLVALEWYNNSSLLDVNTTSIIVSTVDGPTNITCSARNLFSHHNRTESIESLQPIRVIKWTHYYGMVGETLSVQCADSGTIDTVRWHIVRDEISVPVVSKVENVIAVKYNTPVVRDFFCLAQNGYETVSNRMKVTIA